MYNLLLTSSILIAVAFYNPVLTDDYLNEIQGGCYKSKQFVQCAKYKVFRYVDDFKIPDINITSDSSIKIVKIDKPDLNTDVLPEARQTTSDSEFTKIWKFMKRQFGKLVNSQGISIDLPEGARVIQQDSKDVTGRKKSQKQSIIFPALTLLGLLKLKLMVAIILGSVLFIKKSVIIAAAFLPTLISSIKAHCKSQYHVVPYHVEEGHHYHDHEHETSGGDFGLTGYGDGHKAWERRNKRVSYLT